ncbi:site-specific DNA-methyltransferase [Porphyromonas somerae]|uniref:site-specific DNA-methyltransferase n=1 Tax=Porphyromonas somerae TaxID=322095 RepID=UPI002A82106F|nr:site-specific DNA-methyltransferase [Porphyromonas somerae]MDY3884475.1 site-specific DNA-methyltransferase [Porphyromonas somerae]
MEMKRCELTSATPSDFTVEALRQVIPSAFTEVRGEDGQLTHKVDFDRLRELLGDAIADADEERFGFYWVGKQEAKRVAAQPTRQTLRPVEEESVAWESTQNLYIEGDNLEVLKLLQTAYIGKVKMIYIDPPYNTGNDFVYNDDFAMSREEQDEAMGNLDEEGNRLRRNLDTNPRYHSDWCSMIYSRLLVARTLLSNDGVIFISIDDNEVHNLRKICDEVFGASNFVAEYKWNKTATPPSLSSKVRGKYEYIICYEKQLTDIKYNGGVVEGGDMPLLNNGNTIRKVTFPKESVKFNFEGSFSEGQYDRVYLHQALSISNGKADKDIILEGPFKWTQETIDKEIKEETSFIIKSNKFAIRYMRVGERIKRPSDVISKVECNVGTNEDASKDIEALFGKNIMSYPKPVSLIKYLIPFAETNKDSLILDFFSGSATTAHAVMQLNAEDGGKRKYIMVQLPEESPEGSEARKAGYDTICEIGKERIRRAGRQIKEGLGMLGDDLDIGFRVLRLDSSNMEEVYFEPGQISQKSLMGQVDSVKPDRTPLDLLFGCMVDWGVELSLPIRREEVGGKELYIVNNGALVACFEEEIPLETIRYIAGLSPLRLIFRESCFATDADKLNIYEQFKQLCSWSEEEAYRNIRVI